MILKPALVLALTVLAASVSWADEAQVFSPRAVLGAVLDNYPVDEPGVISPYGFRDVMPENSTEVFRFIIEQESLLEQLPRYLKLKIRSIRMIGEVGDAQDLIWLREWLLKDYGFARIRKKLKPPHYKEETDYASLDAIFDAFGYFVARRVEGSDQLLKDLEGDDFWKDIDFGIRMLNAEETQIRRRKYRVELTLRVHLWGETRQLQKQLDRLLPTLSDDETISRLRLTYGDPDTVWATRIARERIPQVPYSEKFNTRYERQYNRLPENIKEAFEKHMSSVDNEKED